MAKTYTKAEKNIVAQVEQVMQDYHPALANAGVVVAVLMVAEYDDNGTVLPALDCHGYPAAATMKVASLKERALGIGDALLTIDEASWAAANSMERRALLDHELTHLELVMRHKDVRKDDLGRPCLRLRKHDWQLGGFVEVVQRHRHDAPEVVAVRRCRTEAGQYFWDFEPPDVMTELLDGLEGVDRVTLTATGKSVSFGAGEGEAAT